MEEGMLTVEQAIERIDRILDRAEGEFNSKKGRLPSLTREEDYVLLGHSLDCMKEAKKHTYQDKDEDGEYTNCQIQTSDIGFRLMRRYFEREGYFAGTEQTPLFDVLLGRLQYHVPQRETQFRVDTLNELIERKVPFPDDYEKFMGTLGEISGIYPTPGICFLPTIYGAIYQTPEGKKNKIGYDAIGAHLVNPSAQTRRFLEDIHDFNSLKEKLDENNTDVLERFRSYK